MAIFRSHINNNRKFPPGVEARMLFNAKSEMFLWPDFLPCAVLMSSPKGVDPVIATFSPEGFADAA